MVTFVLVVMLIPIDGQSQFKLLVHMTMYPISRKTTSFSKNLTPLLGNSADSNQRAICTNQLCRSGTFPYYMLPFEVRKKIIELLCAPFFAGNSDDILKIQIRNPDQSFLWNVNPALITLKHFVLRCYDPLEPIIDLDVDEWDKFEVEYILWKREATARRKCHPGRKSHYVFDIKPQLKQNG